VDSLIALRNKIGSIRGDQERNPLIGCTVLTQPFYLADQDFFPAPSDWSTNIVTGKRYDTQIGEGARLFEQAQNAIMLSGRPDPTRTFQVREPVARYGSAQLMRPRLGQGGFRISVMDEYERRCAMSGERTLPVLEAAHIQPYAENGPHEICNGLFLRSDLHTLFDRGYLTITNDLKIEVSRRIREEFSNGRDYYALHGRELRVLPRNTENRPAKDFMEWHQNHCFLGA